MIDLGGHYNIHLIETISCTTQLVETSELLHFSTNWWLFDGYVLRKVFEIFRQEQDTNI